jgi:hypothetical protein
MVPKEKFEDVVVPTLPARVRFGLQKTHNPPVSVGGWEREIRTGLGLLPFSALWHERREEFEESPTADQAAQYYAWNHVTNLHTYVQPGRKGLYKSRTRQQRRTGDYLAGIGLINPE